MVLPLCDVSPSFSLQWGWGALLLPPMEKEVSFRHTHPHHPVSFPRGPGHSLKPNSCLSQEFLVKEPAEEEVQAGEERCGGGLEWGGRVPAKSPWGCPPDMGPLALAGEVGA